MQVWYFVVHCFFYCKTALAQFTEVSLLLQVVQRLLMSVGKNVQHWLTTVVRSQSTLESPELFLPTSAAPPTSAMPNLPLVTYLYRLLVFTCFFALRAVFVEHWHLVARAKTGKNLKITPHPCLP